MADLTHALLLCCLPRIVWGTAGLIHALWGSAVGLG